MADMMDQVAPETKAPEIEEAGTSKGVMITAKGDGSFEVQTMTDGQPEGEAVPAASIDEAIQSATDALGGAGEVNPDEAGDFGDGENPDAAGDAGTGENHDELADEKARYAQKRGTRPKVKPNWDDYMTGGNPMAK